MNENSIELESERPWWSVRSVLLAALAILSCLLLIIAAVPQLLR